jgi:HlyD family secretion protein
MKVWIIILLVVAGFVFWFFPTLSNWVNTEEDPRIANRPRIALTEKKDIRFFINAAGEISPAEQVSVRPEINGRIALLPVDIGDMVRQGDMLFTLDDSDLQIEKESAEKEVERANLQLEQAERNFNRSKKLFAENLISQELFEDNRTLFHLSQNALARAEKALELVEDRLRKTRIEAPFDCTILTRPVSAGQAVSGSGGFNAGTEVLTIANLHDMIITAHVNQADVTRVEPNQLVEVAVEAVPGLRITGVVERIAPQATLRSNVKGFSARILLKDVDPQVKPGMTANVKIPVATAEDVVAVPLAAVFTETNPETQRTERFVYVKQGNKYEKRPVRIGVSDFFHAEVQQGLAPGEQVSLELPAENEILIQPAATASGQGAALIQTVASPSPASGGSARGRGSTQ